MLKRIIRIFLTIIALATLLVSINKRRRQSKELVEEGEGLLDVRRIWQRTRGVKRPSSACGPTSAAMVIDYLSREKELTYSIRPDDQLVNELYKAVKTYPWGTVIFCLQYRLRNLLNKHSKDGKWRVKFNWAMGQYSDYVSSIEKGNPVIIHFMFNFSRQTFASHHYVVGIGYRFLGSQKQIAVLDPDAGEYNHKIHWIDWRKNEKYMNLLLLDKKDNESFL